MWQFVFVAERRSVVRTELGSCVHPPPACSTSLPSWPTAAYGAGEQLGTVADRSGGRRPAGVGRSRWCAGPAGGGASCRGLALPGRWCWRRRAAASCGRTFLRQEEEASITGSLVARPLFASVTLCRVAPCRHHQLEGPPGAAFTFLLGPFQDPGRGSMWPLWPEPRLPLKWRNILKENLKTRVLCTPRLRWPSPEGTAGARAAVPPASGCVWGRPSPACASSWGVA